MNIYYCTVSVDKEFGNSLSGWFWLRSPTILQLRCWMGLWASELLPGTGISSSKMAHSHGCWHEALLAIGRSSQFLATWTSLWDLLSVPISPGFCQSKWSKREKDVNYNAFYDLALEAIRHHFCGILLFTKVSPVQCGGEWLLKSMNSRRQEAYNLQDRLPHLVKVRTYFV